MDYYSLLNQDNFAKFLQGIIDNDNNPLIVTAAKQILFEVTGNNNISNYPWYNLLYTKYKFNLQIMNTSTGNKLVLYSSLNNKIKYKYIGVIEKTKPKSIGLFAPPSPTPTPSVTPTPSITPSISVTPSITPSISISPSVTPSISVTPSVTVSVTPSVTPSKTVTPTPTVTRTPSITPTPSLTSCVTRTPTPTVTPTVTPSVTITSTPSTTPSVTPTPSVTVTPSVTITPSQTITPTPSVTPTVTPSITVTPSASVTPSVSVTPTPSATPPVSITPSASATPPVSATPSASLTPSVSVTPSASVTPPVSVTPTPSASTTGLFYAIFKYTVGSCSYQPACSSYPTCSPCWDGTGTNTFCGDSNIDVSLTVNNYSAGGATMTGASIGPTVGCSATSQFTNLANITYNSNFLSIASNTNAAISFYFVTPRTDPITGCCIEETSSTYIVTYDDLIYGLQNNVISGTGTIGDPYIFTAPATEDLLSNIGAEVDNLIQTL